MTQTIKHVRHTANGDEYFDVPVAPSNVTATDVYITEELLRSMSTHGHKGDTGTANYSGEPKAYWYRADGQPDRRVLSMTYEHCGNVYKVTFEQPSGQRIEVLLPVK